jgi:hypothetical protein
MVSILGNTGLKVSDNSDLTLSNSATTFLNIGTFQNMANEIFGIS